MVGHIETDEHSQLKPSTTCSLLTVKMNHRRPCYASTDLLTDDFLKDAKAATHRSLRGDNSEMDEPGMEHHPKKIVFFIRISNVLTCAFFMRIYIIIRNIRSTLQMQ